MSNQRKIGLLLGCALLAASPMLAAQQDQDDATKAAELRKQLQNARTEMAEAAVRIARLQRELGHRAKGLETMHFAGDENAAADGDVSTWFEEHKAFDMHDMPPRLGVLLGGPGSDASNEIIGLTPGGGAEAAGLAQGDRLVSVNGKSVAQGAPDSIRESLADVEAGTTVPVIVERDGERLTFEVETSSVLRDVRVFGLRMAPEAGMHEREIVIMRPDAPHHGADGMPPRPPFPPRAPRFSGLGRNSDLISNHAGLEPYFGTAEGVVVLRIDPENAFSLEDGDVVLSLDSEPVGRPVDLGRLMLSREPGEQVVLEIMRQGVLKQLEVTIPERSEPLAGLHRFEIERELAPPHPPRPPQQL